MAAYVGVYANVLAFGSVEEITQGITTEEAIYSKKKTHVDFWNYNLPFISKNLRLFAAKKKATAIFGIIIFLSF